ncbi:MAG TPA: hypothetical protein VEQ42_11725, partial [Pyrinomonadaceae bacterium]|nr:hypothetical protein [Pyrinomonadaceae bacterium]
AGQTNADAVQETSAAPTRDEAVDETREDAPEVAGESERAGEAYLSGDVKIVSVEVKEKNSATGCEIKVSPSPTSSSRARSSSNQSPPTASGSSSAKA